MTDGKLKDELARAVDGLRDCVRLDQPLLFESRRLRIQAILDQLKLPEPDRERQPGRNPEPDGDSGEKDKQAAFLEKLFEYFSQPMNNPVDGQEAAVALHTVHLDELTEQLAELDDKLRRCVTVGGEVGNKLDEQLAELTERVDNIGTEYCNMQSEVRLTTSRFESWFGALNGTLKAYDSKLTELAERVNLQQGQITGVVRRDGDFHDRFKTIEGRLEELTKLVDDHHSTTEGCLIAHQGELKALGAHYHATGASAGRSGPPICVDRAPATPEASSTSPVCEHLEADRMYVGRTTIDGEPVLGAGAVHMCSKCHSFEQDGERYYSQPPVEVPKPACEHPNVTVRSVVLRSGCAQTEVCDKCHAIYADGWHIPQSSAAPPKPACEHRGTGVELHGMGDHSIGIRTCQNRNCQAIWVGGRWYTQHPSSETPPAPPKPACEHPKTRVLIRNRLDAVAVTECESCKDVCVQDAWYTAGPSSETPPAPAQPACEHPNTADIEYCTVSGTVRLRTCTDCASVRANGIWYSPPLANEASEGDEADEGS